MFFEIDRKPREREVVIDDQNNRYTYGDLCDFCAEFSTRIAPGSLVFILCNNCYASLAGYVACLSCKAVAVMLSAEVDTKLLNGLIATYQPNVLLMSREQSKLFGDLSEAWSFDDYVLLKTDAPMHEIHPDIALLMTTSGSTGSPKLIKQSAQNILANARSIVRYLEIDENERPITSLPMNYTYGLSILNSHLLAGATILMTNYRLLQTEFWGFFKAQRASSIAGVPYNYEILKRLRMFKMDLPSLKVLTQAGGKLTPELHKEFAEYAHATGRRFYVMYGQTEATARMGYLPYQQSLTKVGSMGIAIPGGALSLIDVAGRVIEEPDVVGELLYRGENVTLGYSETLADLARGDERYGVLETGDMAKRDADGFYYIVGRKKRFIKMFGQRVNLDECERLVKPEFENLDCACTGRDDQLIVYITDEDETKQVRDFLSLKTGIYHTAIDVRYLPEIPKNESGKTLYKDLAL